MLIYIFTFLLLLLSLIYLYLNQSTSTTTSSIKKRSSNGINTILFLGPSNAGKTTLFSNMLYGSSAKTHTSMKENEGSLTTRWILDDTTIDEKSEKPTTKIIPTTPIKPIHIIDLPGHPRLRTRSLATFLHSSDGLVFLIDGQNGLSGKNVQETGEHLHILLSLLSIHTTNSPSSNPKPLLILLTKSDLVLSSTRRPTTTSTASTTSDSKTLSLSLERAKLSLGREMERRRIGSSSLGAKRSGGGRLEGLEAITTTSTPIHSNPFIAFYRSFLKQKTNVTLGVGGGSSKVLPTDEAEILEEDAFPFEGSFDWDKLGLEISWAWSSAAVNGTGTGVGSEKKVGIGGDCIWNWVDEVL